LGVRGGKGTLDKRKQSLYFAQEMLWEIQAEATRQQRSLSWIVHPVCLERRARDDREDAGNGRSPALLDHASG